MPVATPGCLHVPTLYEQGSAQLSWGPVSGAEGYELYCALDSAEFSPQPGLRWVEIESAAMTWQEIDLSEHGWATIEAIPSGLIYRGPGVPVPGPDCGLTWGELDAKGRTWAQFEAEVASWTAFEESYTLGRSWNSADARWLSWAEFDALDQSWSDIEQALPDHEGHLAHLVAQPLYTKRSLFKLRAFGPSGTSAPLVTTPIAHLPRSLAKDTPPCIHLPERLIASKPCSVAWGGVYGAQGYVLERSANGGGFVQIYRGMPPPSPQPCPNGTHYSVADTVPLSAGTVRYRVRAYNTTDGSQHRASGTVAVLAFDPGSQLTLTVTQADVTAGRAYLVQLDGRRIRAFGGAVLTLRYPSASLTFDRAGSILGGAAQTTLTQVADGSVSFRCNAAIASGRDWSGLVAGFRLVARQAGAALLTLS